MSRISIVVTFTNKPDERFDVIKPLLDGREPVMCEVASKSFFFEKKNQKTSFV